MAFKLCLSVCPVCWVAPLEVGHFINMCLKKARRRVWNETKSFCRFYVCVGVSLRRYTSVAMAVARNVDVDTLFTDVSSRH